MTPVWLGYGLIGLGYISTAQAFQDGFFPIRIDSSDYYLKRGPSFFRNGTGDIACTVRVIQCYYEAATSFPATGNPLCVTGLWDSDGPEINALDQVEYNPTSYKSFTKTNTWCWDQPSVRTNSERHNITGMRRVDELQIIIIEPQVPSG